MSRSHETVNAPNSATAVVAQVVTNKDKSFVVTYLPAGTECLGIRGNESITFSLSVWSGSVDPVKEQMVILEGIQRFSKGWRASVARPITPQQQEERERS